MLDGHFWIAFLLTAFAGAATALGSFSIFLTKKREFSPKFLAASMGFSAGVMLYVSFMEMLPEALRSMGEHLGEANAELWTVLSFFTGIGLIGFIDYLVPSFENPHEIKSVHDEIDEKSKAQLKRMGIFSALAIGIHNFPEGMATFAASYEDITLGISIAIAIAIHNIPEGVAVAVPIYHSTGSRKKAFILSALSGLSEPIGALAGYFIIFRFFGSDFLGPVFAAVAGVMVYISLDELLPSAERYGEHHSAIIGVISGMVIMALSLLLLG